MSKLYASAGSTKSRRCGGDEEKSWLPSVDETKNSSDCSKNKNANNVLHHQ
jgi:hypothetical protein